jgi:uncharacterized membrane protein
MINKSIRSRLLQSLTGFQKVHFFLLLAGFLILILQIANGFLVERQLYFEPDSLIKIPVPDLDNKEELVWEWHDPKDTPSFYKLFFINLFPVLFVLFSTIDFFQRRKGQLDRVKRTFFIVFGLLSLLGMYLIICEPLDLSEDTWLTKIMGSSHWQMNSLKIKERFWQDCFALWNVIMLILFAVIYHRENRQLQRQESENNSAAKPYSLTTIKSWPGTYKRILFVLVIGFIILVSHITLDCLIERQRSYESSNGITIPMLIEDWSQGINLSWEYSTNKPHYTIVALFHFLPTIFLLFASLVLFKTLKKRSTKIVRVFFYISGALLLIQKIIALNRWIFLLNVYQPARWSQSAYFQKLKDIECSMSVSYAIWASLTIILFLYTFKHQKSPHEKPPVPTAL